MNAPLFGYWAAFYIWCCLFQKLQEDLEKHEGDLKDCQDLGADILRQCHPDAVSTVKNWLQAIETRWQEVGTKTNVIDLGVICLSAAFPQ